LPGAGIGVTSRRIDRVSASPAAAGICESDKTGGVLPDGSGKTKLTPRFANICWMLSGWNCGIVDTGFDAASIWEEIRRGSRGIGFIHSRIEATGKVARVAKESLDVIDRFMGRSQRARRIPIVEGGSFSSRSLEYYKGGRRSIELSSRVVLRISISLMRSALP